MLLTKPFPSPTPASPSTCTVSPQQSALEIIRTKPNMSCTPCHVCHPCLPGIPHHSCSQELCRTLLSLHFPRPTSKSLCLLEFMSISTKILYIRNFFETSLYLLALPSLTALSSSGCFLSHKLPATGPGGEVHSL